MTSPIPDRAVPEGLLERVRAATGPDREIDLAVENAVRGGGYKWSSPNGPSSAVRDEPLPSVEGSMWVIPDVIHVPRHTASLDAITALVASRGFGWQVDQTEGAFVSDADDQWHETCATPALSLVGALLVAEMDNLP